MKIEFIIPTYQRMDNLMCLLSSLTSQTNGNWVAHVIADCPPHGTLDKIMKYFKNEERIKFTILPERHNDWGHTPRNIGLELAEEEWVVMTGEDNYYVPEFVGEFLKILKGRPTTYFVYCDMVHNMNDRAYIHIKSEIKYSKMDIGNFVSRTEYAKQIKLDNTYAQSDWKYVVEYLKAFRGDIVYIPKTLYVHN